MILTTTDAVPGQHIGQTLGLVIAAIPYWGTKYAEGITDLNGTTHANVPILYEGRRYQVLSRLEAHASVMGANAVVGIRFHDRTITSTWKELCAYGTAVVLGEVA